MPRRPALRMEASMEDVTSLRPLWTGPIARLLVSWASPRAAGASGHLPQAVPRGPQGTSGQSAITRATSMVPRGVSLEGLLPIGPIAMLGTASQSLGLDRPIRGCPKACVRGSGLEKSWSPTPFLFCSRRQWSQKPGLFCEAVLASPKLWS